MAYPDSHYIEERNGGLYMTGTGVSLDSVVIRFQPMRLSGQDRSVFSHAQAVPGVWGIFGIASGKSPNFKADAGSPAM
jgi:hypothetical protein